MRLRPIAPDEFDEILALHQRSEAFDGIPRVLEMDELELLLDGAQTTMATDTVAAERDGEIIGYGHTYHLPSDVRLERCYVFGMVDPAHRRQGVGTELLSWGMDRAVTLLRSSGSSLPKYIRTDRYDFVEGSEHLFIGAGLAPVRYHVQMRRPLDNIPAPSDPDGVKIMGWPSERTAEVREIKNAAFADHWGSTPTTPQMWDQIMGEDTTRLDLSFVAVDGSGDIVGYCINDRYPADDELLARKEAWIGNLGTLDAYRGRGIASALMSHSLHAFADEGLTHACLDVDSDSLTGAHRLYEKLGFQTKTRTVTYELLLDENPSS